MKATNLVSTVALILTLSAPSQAATMDDYITCSLVYGALFQAAKNADHEGMLLYTIPRVQAVLPFLQEQESKDNPRAKARLSEIATHLEDELKNKFIQQATSAIREGDAEKLKLAMPRVFACDRAFELTSLPLPLQTSRNPRWNKFLEGFNDGCLAKQRRNPSSYSDAQIQNNCRCITNRAAAGEIDASSSIETIAKVISESQSTCFISIQ